MAGTPPRDWTENAFDPALYARASNELNGTPEQRQKFLADHRERTVRQARWLAQRMVRWEPGKQVRPFIQERVIGFNRELCEKADIADSTREVLMAEAQRGLEAFFATRVDAD